MDKIIFLDIDGVLNVIPQGHDEYGSIFHEHFVDNLRKIIDETNAKIVISSSWRMSGLEFMREMWSERNLPGDIVGITPVSYENLIRGYEIQEWIDKYDVKKYVIIDDDQDMLPHQLPFFVKTSENSDHEDRVDIGYGLTNICTEKVIKILNNPDIY